MKIVRLFLIIFVSLFLITGCKSHEEKIRELDREMEQLNREYEKNQKEARCLQELLDKSDSRGNININDVSRECRKYVYKYSK